MIFIIGIWVLFLLVFNVLNLKFFKFMVGSIGIFLFLLLNANYWIEGKILIILGMVLSKVSNYIAFLTVYPEYGMLNISRHAGAITFFLDYECTGILEILVYISLVLFYPIHNTLSKFAYIVFGVLYITVVNVIRVLMIIYIIHILGMEYFFVAHTIVARIIFFVFMVVLYYRTFTLKHILQQKVGH